MSRGKSDGMTKEQPWIGVVPVEMDDSKASTGNQESFTDAMVNKVREREIEPKKRVWNPVATPMDVE